MELTGPMMAGVLLLVLAAVACFLLYRWQLRQKALRSMRAPSQWPITARELVAADEHEVWQWLREVFADYHVMLKLPLVRYIAAATPAADAASGSAADNAVWHRRLSGIHCTFTVCGDDGTVIGCVDLVAPGDEDKAHWYVKESVLAKCGIPYVMVSLHKLPDGESLRTAFIGEIELSGPDMTGPGPPEHPPGSAVLELTAVDPLALSTMAQARNDLQSSLEQQRKARNLPDGTPGVYR